ncbi:MAG: nucleotidyltransferase domain-containing protein [Thiotrichaceae bacterium]|nr:nucleotidyltransferase domain-containing protein [Thiotrichaceae bacterium]
MTEKQVTIGNALFTKTQQQVLRFLFGQPERSFYTQEIVRLAGVGIGTVQRELARLSEVGLILISAQGNQKHYQANPDSPIFEELRGIVVKTVGIADVLKEALLPFASKIKIAFIYGSVARGGETVKSDIDLMLISSKVSYVALMEQLAEAEAQLGRPVNPTVYSPRELRRKLGDGSAFLQRVLQQPKIMLMGEMDDLGEFKQPGKD